MRESDIAHRCERGSCSVACGRARACAVRARAARWRANCRVHRLHQPALRVTARTAELAQPALDLAAHGQGGLGDAADVESALTVRRRHRRPTQTSWALEWRVVRLRAETGDETSLARKAAVRAHRAAALALTLFIDHEESCGHPTLLLLLLLLLLVCLCLCLCLLLLLLLLRRRRCRQRDGRR